MQNEVSPSIITPKNVQVNLILWRKILWICYCNKLFETVLVNNTLVNKSSRVGIPLMNSLGNVHICICFIYFLSYLFREIKYFLEPNNLKHLIPLNKPGKLYTLIVA